MGYLTTVVISNDALGEFEDHPKEFAEAIFKGINQAQRENKQVAIPFHGYCNYLHVEPPRHADHHALFLHSGNMVHVIGAYEKDWMELVKTNPDLAETMIKRAKELLKWAKEQI